MTWEFVGYNMLIFYSALRVVPHSLYEAAEIDGAGQFRVITAIKLPAIRGALVIATIFSIIGSFQLFNEPAILQQARAATRSPPTTPRTSTRTRCPSPASSTTTPRRSPSSWALITMVIAYVVQLRGMRKGA